jgi:ABC-type dipeptide/oligopeptide/nickel transport system permease subunit
MVILFLLVFLAIFAPMIAPYEPTKILKEAKRRDTPCIHILGCDPSKPQHIMGIDGNSRDLFSRVIFGSRLSLQIGLATMSLAIIIGGLIGAFAGYVGGLWT